jgi:hypothetical protein
VEHYRFDVPPTNNGSENAIRGCKLAAKISGCWRTLATLQRHCRIRSYLATARSQPPPPRSHPRPPGRNLLDATQPGTTKPGTVTGYGLAGQDDGLCLTRRLERDSAMSQPPWASPTPGELGRNPVS